MSAEHYISLIEKELTNLRWKFSHLHDRYELQVNDRTVSFLDEPTEFIVSPDDWLKIKHADEKIHEPGLIAWLQVLATLFSKDKVIFYDIGSLFGYHSVIAKGLFKHVKIIAIEGNPVSSEYISRNSRGLDDFKVINAVLGRQAKTGYYLVSGFEFAEVGSNRYFKVIFSSYAKNIIKRVLNLTGRTYRLNKMVTKEIETKTISDVMEDDVGEYVEIFKIDTEGYQAEFLPKAVDLMCTRNAIVLLELDSPKQMRKFGVTNDDLVQLFLRRGYTAIWMNHRTGMGVKQIDKVEKQFDRNSLVALLPESIQGM